MKDIVLLSETGGTLGFSIQPMIIDNLELELGNPIEIEIFKEINNKTSYTMTRPLRLIGSSKGVSIRYFVAEKLNLKSGDIIEVDIRKI
ncbi:MAG: hypothetical protein JXA99_08900 [Candidatus Lokiarchaeota archaeon]|nr:hypothetical protein [Candidatus Lokiarchaeota archaeon]